LLAKLDCILGALAELRRELAAQQPAAPAAEGNGRDADSDFRPDALIEISTAVEVFGRPADTLRYWCRREGCGRKVGGRWLASAPRIRRRLNGD
jgi:hypothetical protein